MSCRARIEAALARAGRQDLNPAHVEAHLRAEHGTLDNLAPTAFAAHVPCVVPYVVGETLPSARYDVGFYDCKPGRIPVDSLAMSRRAR